MLLGIQKRMGMWSCTPRGKVERFWKYPLQVGRRSAQFTSPLEIALICGSVQDRVQTQLVD